MFPFLHMPTSGIHIRSFLVLNCRAVQASGSQTRWRLQNNLVWKSPDVQQGQRPVDRCARGPTAQTRFITERAQREACTQGQERAGARGARSQEPRQALPRRSAAPAIPRPFPSPATRPQTAETSKWPNERHPRPTRP